MEKLDWGKSLKEQGADYFNNTLLSELSSSLLESIRHDRYHEDNNFALEIMMKRLLKDKIEGNADIEAIIKVQNELLVSYGAIKAKFEREGKDIDVFNEEFTQYPAFEKIANFGYVDNGGQKNVNVSSDDIRLPIIRYANCTNKRGEPVDDIIKLLSVSNHPLSRRYRRSIDSAMHPSKYVKNPTISDVIIEEKPLVYFLTSKNYQKLVSKLYELEPEFVDARNENDQTAMDIACSKNEINKIYTLLTYGARLSEDNIEYIRNNTELLDKISHELSILDDMIKLEESHDGEALSRIMCSENEDAILWASQYIDIPHIPHEYNKDYYLDEQHLINMYEKLNLNSEEDKLNFLLKAMKGCDEYSYYVRGAMDRESFIDRRYYKGGDTHGDYSISPIPLSSFKSPNYKFSLNGDRIKNSKYPDLYRWETWTGEYIRNPTYEVEDNFLNFALVFGKCGSEEFLSYLVKDYLMSGNDGYSEKKASSLYKFAIVLIQDRDNPKRLNEEKKYEDIIKQYDDKMELYIDKARSDDNPFLEAIKEYCIVYGFDQEGVMRVMKEHNTDLLKEWAEKNLPRTGGKQRRLETKREDIPDCFKRLVSLGLTVVSFPEINKMSDKMFKLIIDANRENINKPDKDGQTIMDKLLAGEKINEEKVSYLMEQGAILSEDNKRKLVVSEAVKEEISNIQAELEEERARTAVAEKELAEIQQKLQETRQALSESEQKSDKTKEKEMFLDGVGISKLTPNERRELFIKSDTLRKEHPVMQEVSLTTMCRCYVEEKDKKAKLGFLKTLYQIRKGGETRQEKNEMADTFARVLDKAPELKKDENLVALSKRDTVVSQPTRQVRRQVESAGK